jgi:YtkA-like
MRVIVVLGALAAALAIAPLASSGGWATVGFEPLPDGMSAGGTWTPTIYIKQHGMTPLTGLQPVVEIYDDAGVPTGFDAAETAEAGVYEAEVVFPTPGEWTMTIHSGFGDSQVTYGPFAVGAPVGGVGASPELPVVGLVVGLLALCGAVVFLAARRSRRLTPASG